MLNALESSGYDARVLSVSCRNPTLEDDLTLVATSPAYLQKLLDIVDQYSVVLKFD